MERISQIVQQGKRGIAIYIPAKMGRLMGIKPKEAVRLKYSREKDILYVKKMDE